MAQLRERMAHLRGPLEGLQEATTKPVPQGSEAERNVEQTGYSRAVMVTRMPSTHLIT